MKQNFLPRMAGLAYPPLGSSAYGSWPVVPGFIALCLSLPAFAGPEQCMQDAPDGLRICTAPRISPLTYSKCSTTSRTDALAMEQACGEAILGTSTTIESEAKLTQLLGCLLAVGPQNPPQNVDLSWEPVGATVSSYNCGNRKVIQKYGGVELRGHDVVDGYQYGGLFAYRGRTVSCPPGYFTGPKDADGYPEYCYRTPKASCSPNGGPTTVGNPVGIANGEKELSVTDLPRLGVSPLQFTLRYSSYGWYRAPRQAYEVVTGFGDLWRHNYDRRVYAENSPHLLAAAVRGDGTVKHFRSTGREVLDLGGPQDQLIKTSDGWRYISSGTQEMETYDAQGRLTSIHAADGASQTLRYSTGQTAEAPKAGLLLSVTDTHGRALTFTYNSRGQLATMRIAGSAPYEYTFDGNEMLATVRYPDGASRQYLHGEEPYGFASGGGPYGLTGIIDEGGKRYATYGYRQSYWGTADITEHAGGAGYHARKDSGDTISILGPLGSTRVYQTAVVAGVRRVVKQSQPAGAGCGASSQSVEHDELGHVVRRDDFTGKRSCYANDTVRGLVTQHVSGLSMSIIAVV
ncbi:DUF6531 domain-containing protein [Aquabacterium sp. A7-Y]|uniref:DUF6531 domain-containing protein n=1 Tax=Aquabacterium sp. A7-Y TaxID=1349605 RepID=UPI00223D98C4|nr:DUF6531 domain-containing protein [Aquabacterium sp. A7-Y]MCW7542087.1 DUF6531 domain-containing protein [Aquabacterium sp. A7-Y]